MGAHTPYTAEQNEFLRINAPLVSRKELTAQFNAKFGTNKGLRAIKGYCNARKWNSSEDGRYKVGNVSWQTGLSKEEFKSHYTETSFKQMTKNMIEANKTKKIGDEIVKNGEPFVIVSIDYSLRHDKRRIPKRRYVWEQLYGEVPKDHCVICIDGNHWNCEPSNLYCMPKKYRTVLAHNNWWFKEPELILTAIKWCDLFYAIKERSENGK